MQVLKPYTLLAWLLVSMVIIIVVLSINPRKGKPVSDQIAAAWQPPDSTQIPPGEEGDLVHYGRLLIINTSAYLGPKGKVAVITNGMNCQNCHLEAGTRIFGNNYSSVFATYPKFRDRSGSIEDIYKRVNDCVLRSLNGKRPLDSNSREMKAIHAYFKWLGQDVPRNSKPGGAGIRDLPFLGRPADTMKGKTVYIQSCQRCHGTRGEGLWNADSSVYFYPPLWGENSYTTAAGLYRLSRFAGFVRYNMPFDAPANAAYLTDEEAWDVAAFVNSQPRPQKNFSEDWPDISRKPFDHPFGPYADQFSEEQHKYGPFMPIRDQYEKTKTYRK